MTPYDTIRRRLGDSSSLIDKAQAIHAAAKVYVDLQAYEGDTKRPGVAGMLRLELKVRGLRHANTVNGRVDYVNDDEIAALLAAMKGNG